MKQTGEKDAGRRARRARMAGKAYARKNYGLKPFGSFKPAGERPERAEMKTDKGVAK